MTATNRPRRSVLYMPGANPRALEKARGLGADGLIFDLEDSVAPDAKNDARRNVLAALAAGNYGRREKLIRVNALATPWGHDDLRAAATSGADGVLLPKAESAEGVRAAEAILVGAGARPSLAIWCMMETPRGILRAEEIAAATPRLAGFVMGTSDLAKDVHAAHTRDRLPFIYALSHCLLAARASGLACLDGVHLDLADDEGFAFACRQGAEMGFDGKTLIHPKTIAEANRAFSPSQDQIERARRIIAAHADAEAEGREVILVDGQLVERLHVGIAERLVALAEQIALMIEEAGLAP